MIDKERNVAVEQADNVVWNEDTEIWGKFKSLTTNLNEEMSKKLHSKNYVDVQSTYYASKGFFSLRHSM